MQGLQPFWRYYGGKNRAAKLYPAPEHDTIIEPFAGAAGYSCRYHWKKVILVDRSPIIAGVWRYLIKASAEEVLAIPDIPAGGSVDDLPAWVPQEARWLAGFWCSTGTTRPSKRPSRWALKHANSANWSGWGQRARERCARQAAKVSHWQVIQGEYQDAPSIEATWHIDPPYNNKAGSYYPHQPRCFDELAAWCHAREGLVMVCENKGARWLPFRELATIKANEGKTGGKTSAEVIWTNRQPRLADGGQRVFSWGAA